MTNAANMDCRHCIFEPCLSLIAIVYPLVRMKYVHSSTPTKSRTLVPDFYLETHVHQLFLQFNLVDCYANDVFRDLHSEECISLYLNNLTKTITRLIGKHIAHCCSLTEVNYLYI